MPPLRLLLIVLIVLNLLALAAGQGWLGSSEPRGEPQRLSNQINPDGIVLKPALAPDALAPAAPPPLPPAAPAPIEPQRPDPPATFSTTPAESVPRESQQTQSTAVLEPLAAQNTPLVPPEPAQARIEANCIAYLLPQPQADTLDRLIHASPTQVKTTRVVVEPPSTWWVRIAPLASRAAAERRVHELRELGVSDLFIVREPGPNLNAISLGLFRTEARARQHQIDLSGKRVRDTEIVPRNPAIHRIEVRAALTVLEPLSRRLQSEMPQAIRDECPNP